MSFNKYIILLTIVTFVMFTNVQVGATDSFTRDEYRGLWFVIREMIPIDSCNPGIDCAHINIMDRGLINRRFYQHDTKWLNKVVHKRTTLGEMINSEIHLQLEYGQNAVMNVTKFNHGEELIMLGTENRLISRSHTASNEATRAFRRIADRLNMLTIPVSFDDC